MRQNTDYLAPDIWARLWLILNLVYGVILNYLPIMIFSGLGGRTLGWGLRATVGSPVQLGSFQGRPLALVVGASLAFGGAGLLANLLRRAIDQSTIRPRKLLVEKLQSGALATWIAAIGTLVIFVAFPALVYGYLRCQAWVDRVSFADVDRLSMTARLATAVCALAALAVLGLAAMGLQSLGVLPRFFDLITGVFGYGLLIAPAVAGAASSGLRGYDHSSDAYESLALVLVLVAFGFFINHSVYSAHDFYKERLSKVFTVFASHSQTPPEQLPYHNEIWLTEVMAKARRNFSTATCENDPHPKPAFPKLIVCAAACVSDRSVPRGKYASPFVFDPEHSGGAPLFKPTRTDDLEFRSGQMAITLPAIMAISSAAVGPTMGFRTRPGMRMLLGLLNIRLGVWIPNPNNSYFDRIGELKLQHQQAATGWWHKRVIGMRLRWREPGPLYVVREALGLAHMGDRFIQIADGGHWENLGITELLRRRCSTILAFDSSGNQHGVLEELARSVSLARTELDVELVFDAESIADLEDSKSDCCVIEGKATYSDGAECRVIFARAKKVRSGALDLRTYSDTHRAFPYHSLRDQAFNYDRFEAYRMLGHTLTDRAIAVYKKPASTT